MHMHGEFINYHAWKAIIERRFFRILMVDKWQVTQSDFNGLACMEIVTQQCPRNLLDYTVGVEI